MYSITWTVDQEEKSSSFIGYRSGHQGLTRSRGSVKQNTPGRLDSNSLEKAGVPQWQFYHFFDQSQLFSTTADVVVTNSVKRILFFLAFNGFALAVDHGVGGHDAEGRRVRLDDLKKCGKFELCKN